MGKNFHLLLPVAAACADRVGDLRRLQAFPQAHRRRHFIRRTKEGNGPVSTGAPLYPQRQCDTLSYTLSPAEQHLYDATTDYITETYNKARILNHSRGPPGHERVPAPPGQFDLCLAAFV